MRKVLDRVASPIRQAWRWMTSRSSLLSRRVLGWGSVVLAAIILLSVNLIASIGLNNAQVDLTEDRLFMISSGTREVLRGIDEPITVRVYFSKRLGEVAPDYARYFDRVSALLDRYKALSGGKLQIAYLDPEPFSDEEDRAVASGLHSVALNGEGEVGYFGLTATNSTDNQKTIDLFHPDREAFLEYDLTKLIYSLANPKRRVVGLITALPLDGGTTPDNQPIPPWLIMREIREFFDVRTLDVNVEKIPPDIDVLLVAEPYGLTTKAADAIDQYVLGGGKAVVLVDPVPEAALYATMGQPHGGLDELQKVLKAWGVGFDQSEVATDLARARRVRFGPSAAVVDYVAWLGLDSSNIEKNDVLAAGVDTLNVATAGILTKIDGAGTTFTPILHTGPEAMQVDASKVGPNADPIALLRDYKPGGNALILAARLSGETKSAFLESPLKVKASGEHDSSLERAPQAKPDEPKGAHLSSGKINAIVIADTDLMADQFWVDRSQLLGQEVVMPNAQNAAFVIGALENLSGNDALIALRARGVTNRPFTLVENLRRKAELQFQEKEQTLSKRLTELQGELAKLESSGSGAIPSEEERRAAENFRTQMVETRRELRDVKFALHRDIDRLDGWVKFFDIALVPLAIAAVGTGWALRPGRKRMGKNQADA